MNIFYDFCLERSIINTTENTAKSLQIQDYTF